MEIVHTRRSPGHLFRRLVTQHIWRYRRKLLFAALCMAVGAATTAANAYMMQPVLDRVFIEKNQEALVWVPMAVLSIAVLSAAAAYGQTLLMRYVGQRILSDMQLGLFSHLMRCDLGLFHDQSSGRLISRFTNDIQLMRYAVTQGLVTLMRESLSMVFLVGVMLYQSQKLTAIAAGVVLLAVVPITYLSRRMRKVTNRVQDRLGDFTVRLDEVFQGARTVKAYGREAFEETRAHDSIEELFRLYFKAARLQAVSSPMMEVLSGVAIAAVIWYGGNQVLAGVTTPGAFFSFITAFIMAYRPIKAVAGMNTTIQEGLTAANRLFDVLDAQPDIVDAPGAAELQVAQGAEIAFQHVSFHYAPQAGGVEEVTLSVPAGSKVALVGHSGGGKSTLFSLLLRFYDPQNGHITINGQDIRGVTLASLRGAMAFVPQDTVLFDDTVRANIAYGRLAASEEEIQAAARGAAAEEFILRLPQGYDTVIGPHGVKLSGGQRQRLAIARAMLRDAPILLLDEATSALDNVSERLVQDALSRLMQGRTTFMIAHRLSTIVHADIIYVVEHGRVVESGSHETLLAKRGAYHRLYAELQSADA